MFETNPSLIYDAEDGGLPSSPVPLVLIHDGGGTCFSYWCLNPIARTLYGIHNPHYHSGKTWSGGIPEMARHYVALLRRVVSRGPLILGGWSLGGLIALEMAHVLEQDSLLRVVGIVMVDSICPRAFKVVSDVPVVPYKQEWGPNTKEETKICVERCFNEARKMVGQYELPVWRPDMPPTDKRDEPQAGESRDDPLLGGRSSTGLGSSVVSGPPPVILLRAMESVPVPENAVGHVDVARDDRLLGWGEYRADLVRQVVDIPGHHFNIFAMQHIDTVSEKLRKACQTLETSAHTGAF
jgi:thioesterase domain-containing protein